MATRVVALHTISRTLKPGIAATRDTPAVKPVTTEIAPGTVFVVDDDAELAMLLEAKAVSKNVPKHAQYQDQARVVDGPGTPIVEKTSDAGGEKPKDDVIALTDDEKTKLIARGKELNVAGIGGAATWKDETLRRKVEEAETAAAAADRDAGGTGTENLI